VRPEPPLAAAPGPFDDRSRLRWADLIPSWPGDPNWPDDVDLPPGPAPEQGPDGEPPIVTAARDHRNHDDRTAVLSGAGAFGSPSPDGGGRWRATGLFDPGRRGVAALAAVALVVVVIAAVLAWRARPRVDAVSAPPPAGVPADQGGLGGAAPAAAVSTSAGTEVVVAVGGKVRKPGLVRLAPGARVADALEAAGGAQPGVDVAALNLARKVVDGELIMVGVTPPPGAPAGTGPPGAPAGGPINLNTATLAELDTLPGVGPVLAQRILDARTAQGGFHSVSDLRKVDGIGDARYEQLKDLVVV
jgi:competence protein ComEA